jgi:uncharacterized protein (TIGR03086 family)
MAPLSRELALLESAVGYALAGAGMATPQLVPGPTPCPGWDLERLLDHLGDSIGVLREAIATTGAGARPAPARPGPGPDPVARLRGQAARLLGACAAGGPAERRVAIGDRELTASMVAVTAVIEITVHGWDIWVACGARRPVPSGLAAVLLPVAPLLITPAIRPGLFADPVRLPGPAGPGDQLVAFCGRQPRPPGPARARRRLNQAPVLRRPESSEPHRPARGDSRASRWSISVGRQTSGAESTPGTHPNKGDKTR